MMTTHPPKVLVTKIGFHGHDRGSRVVASFLRAAGMEVVYTPPWQDIPAVVKLAMEEDVDVIGVSSLATDHLIVPKLMQALSAIRWSVGCDRGVVACHRPPDRAQADAGAERGRPEGYRGHRRRHRSDRKSVV